MKAFILVLFFLAPIVYSSCTPSNSVEDKVNGNGSIPHIDSVVTDNFNANHVGNIEVYGTFDATTAQVIIDDTDLRVIDSRRGYLLCQLPVRGKGSCGSVVVRDSRGTSNSKLVSMWLFVQASRNTDSTFGSLDSIVYVDTFWMRFDLASMLTNSSTGYSMTMFQKSWPPILLSSPYEKAIHLFFDCHKLCFPVTSGMVPFIGPDMIYLDSNYNIVEGSISNAHQLYAYFLPHR